MKHFSYVGKKLFNLCSVSACFLKSALCLVACRCYAFILLEVNSFWIHLCYFVSLFFLGFWSLKALKPRTPFRPRDLDLFFTSVSAATVSSMSTVEMEVFSNSQLIILTFLMFLGGEVFTSMVGLQFRKSQLKMILWNASSSAKIEPMAPVSSFDQVNDEPSPGIVVVTSPGFENLESAANTQYDRSLDADVSIKYNAIKFLGFVVLGYLLVVHVLGITLLSLYMTLVSSARNVLKNKGLNMMTFSVFTIVSTFGSCGFVPTNENIVVFRKNSGLLLILIPQALLGDTLFPSCLRFSVWFLGKFFKRKESNYLLTKTRKVGYFHLLPARHSLMLLFTVFGFILIEMIMFFAMEWDSMALGGMNPYQKIIGVFFQTVNSRHAGETIVDLSAISPAILVLFVFMMYLPPYTSFLPRGDVKPPPKLHKKKGNGRKLVDYLLFSPVSYLFIFTMLICVTERQKMKEDPLNFSLFNIVIEVVSAYGNVGFSTGYSCERRLNPNGNICNAKSYGFSGAWSDGGKMILILVMFYGRLKKFSTKGGKAWIVM
ncbi:hypothetical protein Tsubulata_001840 [Turnera subulata]|uniref:Uncharacterized protein n=1 Tax=Turnera subulata TaxID=218843 RepID=A0A9Q0G601_9ROSI|nr:hypothetical protein Tsubulata_001840 [Turnera subulata]